MAAELAKLPSNKILTRPRRKRGCLYQGGDGADSGVEGLSSPVPRILGGAEEGGWVGGDEGAVVVRGRWGREELGERVGRCLLRRHIRGSISVQETGILQNICC